MNPAEVSDVEIAFPASVMQLMPPRDECEAGLEKLSAKDRDKWLRFQRTWFFNGLPPATKVTPKDGIDLKRAMRHLSCVQGSFEPKHEHKEAAVAFLASEWFEDGEGF